MNPQLRWCPERLSRQAPSSGDTQDMPTRGKCVERSRSSSIGPCNINQKKTLYIYKYKYVYIYMCIYIYMLYSCILCILCVSSTWITWIIWSDSCTFMYIIYIYIYNIIICVWCTVPLSFLGRPKVYLSKNLRHRLLPNTGLQVASDMPMFHAPALNHPRKTCN